MNKLRVPGILILMIAVAVPFALASGGSSKPSSSIPEPEKTPEQQADDHYNQGVAMTERAKKTSIKLAGMNEGDAKREKTQKKLDKAWKGAINEFNQAVQKNPAHYQALSGLGFCLRKVGDYESSLEAYNRSLSIEPDYTEAIEYRAEAYLGLNRVDEAKQAFEVLKQKNQNHAAELLEAMKVWVEQRKSDPAGVGAQTVNDLDRWIEQNASTMGDVVGHAMPGQKKRW